MIDVTPLRDGSGVHFEWVDETYDYSAEITDTGMFLYREGLGGDHQAEWVELGLSPSRLCRFLQDGILDETPRVAP